MLAERGPVAKISEHPLVRSLNFNDTRGKSSCLCGTGYAPQRVPAARHGTRHCAPEVDARARSRGRTPGDSRCTVSRVPEERGGIYSGGGCSARLPHGPAAPVPCVLCCLLFPFVTRSGPAPSRPAPGKNNWAGWPGGWPSLRTDIGVTSYCFRSQK